MMLHLANVLTPDELNRVRQTIDAGPWTDGAATAGAQAARVKQNRQLRRDSPQSLQMGALVQAALQRHPLFVPAALPAHILPPRFNAYGVGDRFGEHVDGAIHPDPSTGRDLRADVSVTLFLSDPDDYEGGELVIEDTYGAHEARLAAGDAILYPATSLHRVELVTRGRRVASFLWVQSLVRDAQRRRMLFDLDMTIIALRNRIGDESEVVALTSHYHNLLRQWAEC
ncbi:MAG: Fe2+-dependent dioxygenase [Asticcacaulis sp.]